MTMMVGFFLIITVLDGSNPDGIHSDTKTKQIDVSANIVNLFHIRSNQSTIIPHFYGTNMPSNNDGLKYIECSCVTIVATDKLIDMFWLGNNNRNILDMEQQVHIFTISQVIKPQSPMFPWLNVSKNAVDAHPSDGVTKYSVTAWFI